MKVHINIHQILAPNHTYLVFDCRYSNWLNLWRLGTDTTANNLKCFRDFWYSSLLHIWDVWRVDSESLQCSLDTDKVFRAFLMTSQVKCQVLKWLKFLVIIKLLQLIPNLNWLYTRQTTSKCAIIIELTSLTSNKSLYLNASGVNFKLNVNGIRGHS